MEKDFILNSYDYRLPPENIAQHPAEKRDHSRLLVLDANTRKITHRKFLDIAQYIDKRDMLVVNDTRVFPARLHGRKTSGGKAEVFLLGFPSTLERPPGEAEVTALIRSSKRPRPQSRIIINSSLAFTVIELLAGGKARLRLEFDPGRDLAELLGESGQIPLPPYIGREQGTSEEDRRRYQTVYADRPGAVAAPTAGLHFTEELLGRLQESGVLLGTITLHVGYGTFAPVRAENIMDHQIHHEYVSVPQQTVEKIEAAKARGGRIWAVGTTTVRALEFAAARDNLRPVEDWCDLYIYPGFTFKVVDDLITNFHLPGSSLMFLVAALCGRKTLLACYQEAIANDYRFYSYGDAMAVIGSAPR